MKNIFFICLLILGCAVSEHSVYKVGGERQTLMLQETNNEKLFYKAKRNYKEALKIEINTNKMSLNKVSSMSTLQFKYNKAMTLLKSSKECLIKIHTLNFDLWKKKTDLKKKVQDAIVRVRRISRILSHFNFG